MSDLGPTSSKSSSSEKSEGREKSILPFMLGMIVLLGIAAGVWVLSGKPDGNGTGGLDPATSQQLELTRTALAATENLELIEADESWNELYRQAGSDQEQGPVVINAV